MITAETQSELVAMLAKHEEGMAHLYALFAGKFPENADFWEKLSEEEVEHAQLLRTLQSELEQGLAVLRDGRLSREAIAMAFEYFKSIMAFVKQTDLSESMALSIALDLEDTLIERAVFTSREDDPEALQLVWGRLGVDVRDHYRRIHETWEQYHKHKVI